MKGQILITIRPNGRYEFLIHVRSPVVITSFYTYARHRTALNAAIREAKRLGIDAT
jgi:hypothetical protein